MNKPHDWNDKLRQHGTDVVRRQWDTAPLLSLDNDRGGAGGPELIARCAADVKPEPLEWLWRGRVALGKLTLIAGEAGLGKSQLSIAMAAAVTTGG